MSETLRLIDFGENVDPFEYHSTLEAIRASIGRGTAPNTLTFVQMYDHVLLAKGTNISKKVKLEYCKGTKIPIVRSLYRGTGLVFYNPCILQCSLSVSKESPFIANEKMTSELWSKYVSMTFKEFGVELTRPAKTNNLICGGKKIGVIVNFVFGKVLWFGFNIFIASSVEQAEKAIVSSRDMRATCTALSKECGKAVSANEIRDAILQSFGLIPNLELDQGNLSTEEVVLKEKIREKYTSESWIKYGKWSPVKDYWRSK